MRPPGSTGKHGTLPGPAKKYYKIVVDFTEGDAAL